MEPVGVAIVIVIGILIMMLAYNIGRICCGWRMDGDVIRS
jgi:hypothetical protein